jgi:hypothetical protein
MLLILFTVTDGFFCPVPDPGIFELWREIFRFAPVGGSANGLKVFGYCLTGTPKFLCTRFLWGRAVPSAKLFFLAFAGACQKPT